MADSSTVLLAFPIDCSDKEQIARLYKTMASAAVAKATSIVRREDVGAEIAHDSFIKLWQSGARFPNERAAYAWIYKTCHRAAIDHLRSAAHRREQFDDEPWEGVDPGATGGDVVLSRQTIKRYLNALAPEEAEAFVYVALDGMTQIEVAELMGLSRRTVQRLMDKVEAKLARLRMVLEGAPRKGES